MRWSCSSAICPTCVFPLIYTNNGTVPPALRPKYKQQICLKLAIMKPQNTKYQLSWQEHCSFLGNKYSLPSNGGDISAARYHPVSPYTAARAVPMVREWIWWWTLLYSNICATYFMFCFRSNDIFLKWGKWKLYRLFKWNKQPKKEIEVRQMRCPTLTEEFPLLAGPSCVIVENVGAPILSCTTAWAHHSADARWLQSEPSLLHRLCFLLNDVKNSVWLHFIISNFAIIHEIRSNIKII